MPNATAYKIRIRTDSADSNALMLVDAGELVAVLVELADESHGGARGQWTVEATFGLKSGRQPILFATAADAAALVSNVTSTGPFDLNQPIAELGTLPR